MSVLGDGVTWADWARMVASELSVFGLSDVDLDRLLWNRTAWPCSITPAYIRPQLLDALEDCSAWAFPSAADGERLTGARPRD